MKKIKVACAIILKNNKILVAQRSGTMDLPLKWEFPGGKIKDNETDEECLHREISEELNIKISVKSKLKSHHHRYEKFEIILIPFITNYESGDLTLMEHKQALWFSKDELSELDWAEADKNILNEILVLI